MAAQGASPLRDTARWSPAAGSCISAAPRGGLLWPGPEPSGRCAPSLLARGRLGLAGPHEAVTARTGHRCQTGRAAELTGRQDTCGSRGHGHSGVTGPPWLLGGVGTFWGVSAAVGNFFAGPLNCSLYPSLLGDRQHAPHLAKGSSCCQHPRQPRAGASGGRGRRRVSWDVSPTRPAQRPAGRALRSVPA